MHTYVHFLHILRVKQHIETFSAEVDMAIQLSFIKTDDKILQKCKTVQFFLLSCFCFGKQLLFIKRFLKINRALRIFLRSFPDQRTGIK